MNETFIIIMSLVEVYSQHRQVLFSKKLRCSGSVRINSDSEGESYSQRQSSFLNNVNISVYSLVRLT